MQAFPDVVDVDANSAYGGRQLRRRAAEMRTPPALFPRIVDVHPTSIDRSLFSEFFSQHSNLHMG